MHTAEPWQPEAFNDVMPGFITTLKTGDER